MTLKDAAIRLLGGLALLLTLLVLLFALTLPIIHRWGATNAEVGRRLPGDELLPSPLIKWTHGVTIDAPPDQVWPWLAQLGDARGGFYSFTFIENRIGALMGAADYQVVYTNADRAHPEWQNPQPGDVIIQGTLKLRDVQPGRYLLADSLDPQFFYWLWLWQVEPAGAGDQTRLLVRFGIDLPGEDSNPVMTFVMDIGGFVMEQRMLQGIKLRAEGGQEPAWMETAEIVAWFTALLAGLAATLGYLLRPNWRKPLAAAVAAVVALFVLTFVQPALWVRVVVDAVLLAGVVWAWEPASVWPSTGWRRQAAARLTTVLILIALLSTACQPVATPEPTTSSPLPLALKWPAPGEATDAAPLLQWQPFPGATHYQITLRDSGAGFVLQQDTTHPLFRVSPPLAQGASYAWEVQAQDANHAVLAELRSQFSVWSNLVLVWPPDREAVDEAPLLQWQAFEGAAQYRVVITLDQPSPPAAVVDQVVAEPRYAVSPPLAPGAYRWTVEAQDAEQRVLAVLSSRFSVKDHLEVFEPAPGAEVGATPTFRWAPYPDATQYQVVVVDTQAYPPVVVIDTLTRGTVFMVAPALVPATDYSLTVRALSHRREVLAEANTTFRVYATAPFFDCGGVRGLPAVECQALVTLHQTTGGTGWSNSANWLSTNVPCEWSGVACADGHVTDLYLAYNGLSGPLPAALGELTGLRSLLMSDNALTGPLPPELARLERLMQLDLSGNQLSGPLPPELGRLAALEALSLQNNQLSGALPAAWSGLTALRLLDLGHNALTGALPAELGQWQQLQTLRLGHNQLSGSLPAELGQLVHLAELDVSYNQLSGPVPDGVLRLPTRALWGNRLEGTLDCSGTPAIEFQYAGFTCVSSLGASVWPEVLPAIAPDENAPFWLARPEQLRFTFAAAPGAAPHMGLGASLSDQAQLLIIPARDYQALDRLVRLEFGDLVDLLRDRPAAVEGELPLLPISGAGQALHAQVRYLDFANGSGVRYLTQNATGLNPISNYELYYTFQGLTADREYLVAAFWPVSLPGLPATNVLSEDELTQLLANYQAYLADTTALLEAQAPEAFQPDLAQIDRLIESLVVHASAP